MKFELLENEILGEAALVGQPTTIYRDAPVRVKMRVAGSARRLVSTAQ